MAGDAYDDYCDSMDDYAFGFPSYEENRDNRRCRYCEEGDLHWEETNNGWRLFDDEGDMHDCRQQPASIDDFEDVS
jgi:hypothetical protein